MPWFPVNVSATLIWFLLFWNTGSTSSESVHREKRVAVLGTTEIPAASVDLSQFNFTDLVNGMLSKALTGAKKFFSFLSVTSYSSMAFHKVSIAIYNISNIKYVDYQKFPMRYCYCLNNRTNDLADYTLLLLDIVGNTTSSLTELFKSTSIVSVSQSNESDCIYFCVMTGRTGRNLSDLWDLTQKPPIINFTFPKNESSHLDIDSILPNLISSAEDTEMIVDPPKELWTSKTATGKHLEDMDNKHKMSPTVKSKWSSAPSSSSHDISFSTSSSSPEDRITKGLGVIGSSLLPVTQGLPSIGQSISFTKLSSWPFGDALKGNDFVPTRTPQLVGSLVPKGQHQPSEKISLFPQNAFKEHSISFSSHKSQEGSQFKLPEWTTMAALEMLERPYSLIPLWAKTDHKTDSKPNGISSSQQPTRSPPAISRTQTDHSFSRISSLSEKHLPPGGSQALHASVSTLAQTSAPVHQISSTKLPVMQDSVAFDRQDLPTKRVPLSQHTHRKRDEIQSSMIHTSLGTVPQVKPLSMDGHKMAVHAYTQSRCLQAKAAATSPSITLAFQKVNPCVMELCRFFHQCLCVSQEQYSRHKTERHCTPYYTWYLRNATYICEKFKRHSHTRTLRQKCLVNICKSI